MRRIAILGSSGAGKSTLAATLGGLLGYPVYHLDALLWQTGWHPLSDEARRAVSVQLAHLAGPWIIDGCYLCTSTAHLAAADTLIVLDTPPLQCAWRLLSRHLARGVRPDLPVGCTDLLSMLRLLKALTFPWHGRRKIERVLRQSYTSKHIIRLASSREIAVFLATLISTESTPHQR